MISEKENSELTQQEIMDKIKFLNDLKESNTNGWGKNSIAISCEKKIQALLKFLK